MWVLDPTSSAFPRPLLKWPAWQLRFASLADTRPGADSDGDALSNLQEFAFGLSPHSGVAPRPAVRVEVDSGTGRIDLCVDRVTGMQGVALTVELMSHLGQSPQGWTPAPALVPIITPRLDQTEELRFADVASHPVFASASQGFARLRLELDSDLNGDPEHVEKTATVGWSRVTLAPQTQTFSSAFAPFHRLASRVDAIVGTTLTLAGSLNGTSTTDLLAPGAQYYLEVLSGTHAGHRLEVDESATAAVNLASIVLDVSHSRHTLPGNLPPTLVGATVALRPHQTLNGFADRSLFRAGNSVATADRMHFFNSGSGGFQTYWLFAFPGSPRWVRQGDGTLSDQGGFILEPGRGLFIHVQSTPVSLTLRGHVRDHAFACPLAVGPNFIAPGWPMGLSPEALGMSSANGFTGGSSAARADQLQIWNGDSQVGAQGYSGLYLLQVSSLRHWTWMGDSTLTNQSATPVFQSGRSTLILSRQGLPDWRMPLPWRP